jgi:hypothetical protein
MIPVFAAIFFVPLRAFEPSWQTMNSLTDQNKIFME